MEELGVSAEEATFGRAVCYLVTKEFDFLREALGALDRRFSAAVGVLEESGCARFVDEAAGASIALWVGHCLLITD